MSNDEELKLHITVWVNKERSKVLFAEASSAFMDVLLSFLLLPLGKILKVLEDHNVGEAAAIGSLTTLYRGIVNLGDVHFRTELEKQKLLSPASHYDTESEKLMVNVFKPVTSNPNNSVKRYDGVFTKSRATFIISDDLKVIPNVMDSIMDTVSALGIDVTDTDNAEMLHVSFGSQEFVDLLRLSLVSRNPLTAFVLSGGKTWLTLKKCNEQGNGNAQLQTINDKVASTNTRKMALNAIFQKSTNKFLFAQADFHFINFLYGMLTVPLGSVVSYLGSNSGLEAIDNLHRSISDESKQIQLKSPETKLFLTISNINQTDQFSRFNFDPHVENNHVKGESLYKVNSDLYVSLLGNTKMEISAADIEEVEVQVGLKEGLSILKEALISTTALEDGLIENLCLASRPVKRQKHDF